MNISGYRVLGIDPGYDRLGVAVVEKTIQGEKLLFSDCLISEKKETLPQRIFYLANQVEKIIKKYQPQKIAMEKVFFTVNKKTAVAVAEMRGAVDFLAGKYNLSVIDFSPPEIKTCLTGYGQADKKQVITLVSKILKLPTERKLDDEYDAIAIALTCLAKNRF